jgi:hypothetical protein
VCSRRGCPDVPFHPDVWALALPYGDRLKFTWANSIPNLTYGKLDRTTLMSTAYDLKYPLIFIHVNKM